jgi:hypothetical protein
MAMFLRRRLWTQMDALPDSQGSCAFFFKACSSFLMMLGVVVLLLRGSFMYVARQLMLWELDKWGWM